MWQVFYEHCSTIAPSPKPSSALKYSFEQMNWYFFLFLTTFRLSKTDYFLPLPVNCISENYAHGSSNC